MKNDNESSSNDNPEETIKVLRIYYSIDINHQEEVKQALSLLPDQMKYSLANTPIVLLINAKSGFDCASYIKKERNIWFRCKDPEAELFFIIIDVWWELQKDRRYVSKLRNPKTGRYLPEIYRYPSFEAATTLLGLHIKK